MKLKKKSIKKNKKKTANRESQSNSIKLKLTL